MSLALAATLAAASTATIPSCSWDAPGHRPFVGDVVAAVDRYRDIPAPVRSALKKRMAERRYDEIVIIKRDAIVGRATYAPEIREMHFGTGQVCGVVTRAKWTAATEEMGLVYCESSYCVMVPTVCRNVSLITRVAPPTVAEKPPPVVYEPPSAGPPEVTGSTATPQRPQPPVKPFAPPETFAAVEPETPVTISLSPEPPPLPDELPPLPPLPVPEPASGLLMGAGVAALLAWRRYRATAVNPG